MKNNTIIESMNWRIATKVFDKTKKVTDEDLNTILESGRLSPSVFGLEPWKFIIIKNTDLREKLRKVSYDQSKVTDASYIIVIATRTDAIKVADELIERTAKIQGKKIEDLKGLSDTVHGAVSRHGDKANDWLMRQSYIPLGIMIETASLLSVDSGPMEGFNNDEVDEILGLKEKNLHSTTMLALGYRGEDPYASIPKVRKTFEDAFEIIN